MRSNSATPSQLHLIRNMMRTSDQIKIVAGRMQSLGIRELPDMDKSQAEQLLSDLIDYLRRVTE